ncbi:VapE family protein [Epilithonimonas ginsengisoli]|uniref:VapE family protein n=1 Tax=Epilithonimonas ginsengisoli TaxID=1245592 RepID=A0ABU4JMM8_9FLAO|nr:MULTISPECIES: VapE domain-containing protein [Chryseobacterium group]MBV6881894.1 virulence-associated E family protein [Epilithonimonas sp. FP105]MDW8550958.1 VapE family protein [Epilithonimonas ginsengisoli]OAH73795.1 virulence-associated E family protein [Chryseobacterium sp. FP211-J200]
MKSTIFKNFNEVVEQKDILKILDDIKTGTYRNAITYLRKSLAEDKKEAAERAKKALPAFTPSATFKGGRKMEFLTNYNALVVLDIDKITKEKLTESKENLQKNEFVFAAFTSPSGNGLKVFVKVTTDKTDHKETFLKLQTYFENLLQLEIDKSGKDITRLCFFSYDSDLYLNENAEVFTDNPKVENCHSEHSEGISKHQSNPPADYDALYTHCIQFTEKKYQFVEGSRNYFVFTLANNLNRKGVPESLALGYILADYDYNTQEVMSAVKSAYSNTSEYATDNFTPQKKSVKSARSASVKKNSDESSVTTSHDGTMTLDDEEEPAQIDKLENFLNNRYKFRYNEVLGKLEYIRVNGKVWKYITDFKENSILREIQKAKVRCSINSLRNLLHSDFCEMYGPFKDYFENLPEYSGDKDHIEELALTITTTKPDLWKECFKKWFVAMVACVLDEKQINQTVIVFSGKQGLGKTTWIEKLMPRELKQYIFSGTVNPNNKDTLIHLAECMLINLDEIENLNRTEIGSLKELITKTHIRMRKAYGHNNENMPRRASFAGSVNTAQFLNDTTGSRRFLCFELENIEYQHNVDINLCYAQAVKLFKDGFRHWFNQEEIKDINANNEQYQLKSPEEELLLTWFEPATRETANAFLNASQIAVRLATVANINVTDGTVNKLGKALKKHGFIRIVRNKSYVYVVNVLDVDEVDRRAREKEKVPQDASAVGKIPYRFNN